MRRVLGAALAAVLLLVLLGSLVPGSGSAPGPLPPGLQDPGNALPVPSSSSGPGNTSGGGNGSFTFAVTFLSEGLPSGTSWAVELNGTTLSSTTGSITFPAVPAGVVAFRVTASGGYTPVPAQGTVEVPTYLRVDIGFSAPSGDGSFLGGLGVPPLEVELLLGIGVGGLGAILALEWLARRPRRPSAAPVSADSG